MPLLNLQDEQRAMLEQEQRHAEMARLRQQEQAATQQQQHQAKLAPWAKKSSSSSGSGSAAAASSSSSSYMTAEENGGGRSLADIQRMEQEEKRRRDIEEAEERRIFAQQVNQVRLCSMHIQHLRSEHTVLCLHTDEDRYGSASTVYSQTRCTEFPKWRSSLLCFPPTTYQEAEEEALRRQAKPNWAATASAGLNSQKTLAEIQAEESRLDRQRQEKERQERAVRQKEMGLAQASVWGSASANLSWAGKASSNGASGNNRYSTLTKLYVVYVRVRFASMCNLGI